MSPRGVPRPHLRVVAVGQAADERVRIGGAGRLHNLRLRGIVSAIRYVRLDGGGEQRGLLPTSTPLLEGSRQHKGREEQARQAGQTGRAACRPQARKIKRMKAGASASRKPGSHTLSNPEKYDARWTPQRASLVSCSPRLALPGGRGAGAYLGDEADLTAQSAQVQGADVVAVNADHPLKGVVEPGGRQAGRMTSAQPRAAAGATSRRARASRKQADHNGQSKGEVIRRNHGFHPGGSTK
jgi:hypothetical protein